MQWRGWDKLKIVYVRNLSFTLTNDNDSRRYDSQPDLIEFDNTERFGVSVFTSNFIHCIKFPSLLQLHLHSLCSLFFSMLSMDVLSFYWFVLFCCSVLLFCCSVVLLFCRAIVLLFRRSIILRFYHAIILGSILYSPFAISPLLPNSL